MRQFEHISPENTQKCLKNDEVVVVDIRDKQSFMLGHIPNAVHLGNHNVADFVNSQDVSSTLIVCCYHGVSSQQAAQYLVNQGFDKVYSMDGGFEAWKNNYPVETGMS